jgi:hypothetical protein
VTASPPAQTRRSRQPQTPAVGRLVSIAVDRFDTTIVPPLAIELVIGGVLLAAHYTLN